MKIEEKHGYSLDWIYGLREIMVEKDKEFYRYTQAYENYVKKSIV